MNSLVKDNDEYLKDLYVNTLKYLNNLWYEPKIVAKLLLNSDIEDVNIILAPFFCHNFYQNIISPFSVEENLLYIICIMLKEEKGEILEDKTFNKLRNIQILIRKESSLKGLCKYDIIIKYNL
jgi:hypothetical protein